MEELLSKQVKNWLHRYQKLLEEHWKGAQTLIVHLILDDLEKFYQLFQKKKKLSYCWRILFWQLCLSKRILQKRIRLHQWKQLVKSKREKKIILVKSSFNISIITLPWGKIYFKEKNENSKRESKNYRLLSTMQNIFQAFVIFATIYNFVSLTVDGFELLELPLSIQRKIFNFTEYVSWFSFPVWNWPVNLL